MKEQRLKAVFNWSGGKDSALALHKVLKEQKYQVIALLTTINKERQLSTMHNIPVSLLKKQADSIGITLYIAELNPEGNMEDYRREMQKAVEYFKKKKVAHFIFGDIYLDEIRAYREKSLEPYGIEVVEPLWGKTSEEIMQEFLDSGLQTIVVTIMADKLKESFIGRVINQQFMDDLPEEIDICGENGEYHTFCFSGNIFKNSVNYILGKPFCKTSTIKQEDGTEKNYSYWFLNLQDV